MATAKGSTAGRAKSANTAPVASTEGKDTGGVEADLLKFVDPEAAKAAESAEKEADKSEKQDAAAEVPAGPEAKTEVPAEAAAGNQDGGDVAPKVEVIAEAPEADATGTVGPAGRDYLVLATALAAPDGTLRSRGQVIELTADKAEWLLDRGMVKPA